jgi:hemolysin activation/secretion protein
LFDSDQSQTNLSVRLALSQAHQDLLFLNARTELTTRITEQLGDSVLNARIKTTCKDWFYQTLVAQISTVMGFDLGGRGQVILGGTSGLRGYSSWAFSGEKKLLLNFESRTIFRGGVFKKIETLIVLGSTIFADVGYVWNGAKFNLRAPKRSFGFGLRFSLPKLTESRVYRLDLAYPLDAAGKSSFKPVITYGIGHVF